MEGLERAIKIIKHEIMKRESQRDSPEYLLRRKLITEEIKSLDKALTLVKDNGVLDDVSGFYILVDGDEVKNGYEYYDDFTSEWTLIEDLTQNYEHNSEEHCKTRRKI